MKKPTIIIIGGGFGGLNAAISLKKAEAEVLFIDKTNHHLFQPLLYQVATAALSPANIAASLRQVVEKNKNTTVLLANIVQIETKNKRVIASNGDQYDYDYLILAPGARHSYFGKPQWEVYAPGLKTLPDAIKIRENILLSYEKAERYPYEAEKLMTFVIVGGGPTGVEMAGAIGEIAHKTLIGCFRHIDPNQTKIYLIEGEKQILPAFPKDLADKAQNYLEKFGVTVLLNTYVTNVTEQGVWMGSRLIETNNVIWAAGNEASPLLASLGVPLDKSKRVIVNQDLTIPRDPSVFVIGDAACFIDKGGRSLPALAPVAIQQGRYVANILRKNILAQDRKPFVYSDKGMMATVGQSKAIAMAGKLKLSGYFAWLAWSLVHIMYLISYANKVIVMLQWVYLYIFQERTIQLITRPVSENEDLNHKD